MRTSLLASCVLMLVMAAEGVRAQSALDGFNPNANGVVYVIVVQPDEKILIGGDFTTLAPNGGATVTRNRIARLNPDGTLDPTFNPDANGTVRAIALQGDGKILAGGSFTSIGGQNRNRIARLDAVTGLADSFDPNANSTVFTIAVQTDGKILAGGFFNNIGGQTRNRIARLDFTTGLADSFDPNPNGPEIFTIVLQADGKILVGGFFTSIGGQTRNNIARLDPISGIADSFNPNASDEVRCIALQADGKILAGGFFTLIGGETRNNMARLNSTTGLADSLNPNPSGGVFAIALQTNGKILLGGEFFNVGGQSRHLIARLDPTTGLADSFDPSTNSSVNALAVQEDGKVLVGGGFSTLSPNGSGSVTRNRIARLEIDGRLDQTLNLNTLNGFVGATAFQPDGKIIIGGGFTTVLGVTRNRIARLNTDGTLDMSFNPDANDEVLAILIQPDGKILVGGYFNEMDSGSISIGGAVRNFIARLDPVTGLADSFDPNASFLVLSLAMQPNGKILAGGYFTTIGGQARNRIARLDPITGLPDSFNPNANSIVLTLATQPDGKILAGGSFTSIGGQLRSCIARIDPNSGLADSFNPNANDDVWSIALQPDGNILAGGFFTTIGGQTRNRIARLNPTTGLADSFDPNANGTVYSIAVQSDGKIIAGGTFNGANSIGGQLRNRIARLDPTTGLADSFDPNANELVYSIAVQNDGKIISGGVFTSVGGQTRTSIARLTNDIATLQNLGVAQNTISWLRGGAGSHFRRVTFEYSDDSLSYAPLGNGSATGTNWALTGLNLPVGQNFYIRARGYYHSGLESGCESMTESVRNVFLVSSTPTPAPTPTPALVSISGTILNCANTVPGPVPSVTLNLTGSAIASTLSDGAGNYQFSSLPGGGSYTITPTKAGLNPGATGIDTVDVVAIQRHFLNLGNPLSGCRLTAANVNGVGGIDTVDVIAVQRFFLGFFTGIANAGRYQFNPASRTYSAIMINQTGQNYDGLVFGDVVTGSN